MRATLRLAGYLVALLLAVPACASTKSWKDLDAQQIAALQASQQRLDEFDRALQMLDQRRARGRVSAKDYRFQQHQLVGFIANEAEFENAILQKEGTSGGVLSSEQMDKLQEGCEAAALVVARVGLQALTLIR